MAIVNEINEKTKDFAGMRVPVKVFVDVETKRFRVEVGTPTTAALIVKELRLTKGSHQPAKEIVGDLPMRAAIKIAIIKKKALRTMDIKKAVKQVIGTCQSMGVTVDGKSPKEVQKAIDEGVYDELFKEFIEEWKKS